VKADPAVRILSGASVSVGVGKPPNIFYVELLSVDRKKFDCCCGHRNGRQKRKLFVYLGEQIGPFWSNHGIVLKGKRTRFADKPQKSVEGKKNTICK
jgi:hypothetical protein